MVTSHDPADYDARLAEYVERKLAEAPPMTPEQRDCITVLLRGTGVDAA